jgi:hypothetical protein
MTNKLKQIFDENADCYFTMEMQSAMTESKFIEVVSELMKEVETKLKEPNFYIVNSIKYLTDEQRNSVAEKIAQMKPTDTWIKIKSEDDLPKDDKNVLAMIDGEMKIMCLSDIIENGVSSKVWCLVYDGLDGDGIYDDNYYPTHWMPLPTHPQTKSTKIN